MIPYWLLFIYFAAGAVVEYDVERRRTRAPILLAIGGTIIALMVGLRYKVGADWKSYEDIFIFARLVSPHRLLSMLGDPAYSLLTLGVSRLGGAIWQVNLVCGLIFSWGLLRFARAQPNPWLAMTVGIPYLVVVVAMGYSRQAVAIGILMAGLAAVINGASTLQFAGYVVVAALFHKTAAVLLPLVAFSQPRNRLINLLVGLALSVLSYDVFLSERMNVLYRNYIKAEYSSQGAGIRVVLNLIPAVLYIINRRNFGFSEVESKLWYYFSIAAFGLSAMLLVLPSSTAVDRMGLYVIPLQLAIWSRVHTAYHLHGFGRVLVVGLAAAVLFIWLNFAVHAIYWIPYRIYPIFG